MKQKILLSLGAALLIGVMVFRVDSKYKKMAIKDNLAVYVNDELQDSIPKKDEAMFIKAECDNNAKGEWDNEKWGLLVSNMGKKTKCNLYFYQGETVFDFDYTGGEQTFTVPVSGTYKLEVWGAQGGNAYDYYGGYGGYSNGIITLSTSDDIYIGVGGSGKTSGEGIEGGYNGGGSSTKNYSQPDISRQGSGGGATHIAKKVGLLSSLKNYQSDILIVSGGGGGANYWPGSDRDGIQYGYGGHAGGYNGNSGSSTCTGYNTCHIPGIGGNQVIGGTSQGTSADFGIGGSGNSASAGGAGGGAGYYGGGGSLDNAGGGGGSGYIGNSLLTNKAMYCYNCEESDEESTKTISTTCNEETPTENCAKKGNGYARITLISVKE